MPDLPKPNTVPICPFFYQCGGCETQDISYQDQVAYKSTWLQELFSPLASEVMWKDFLSSPQAFPIFFRNKIRFGFVKEEGKVFPSRHSKGSEEADIAVDTCFLQSPESVRIVQFTAKFAEDHNWTLYNPKTGTGWLKHLLIRQGKRTGETMLSLVTDAGTIPGEKAWIQQVTSEFPSVISLYQNSSWGRSNEHLEDRHLFGKTVIHEKIGDYNFQISPQAFFQTNSSMVEILYEAIKNTIPLSKNSHIWDLYAGSATIGIYLSQLVKEVLAIESNPSNIVDAQKNLELNNVRNVRIESGTVESVLTSAFIHSLPEPELIIIDPPRAGLSKQIKSLLPYLPKHDLIYVSCNPSTCKRDLEELCKHGYQIRSLQGIDMFPHTLHCEMIAHLSK